MIALASTEPSSVPSASDSSLALEWFIVRRMLPHRGPMAMLDGVESYNPAKGEVLAFKLVPGNDPMVNGFDPDDPALPQPVVVEALAQSCGLLMNVQHVLDRGMSMDELRDPVKFAAAEPPPLSVLAESRVTHHGLARPGDKVTLHCGFTLRRRDLASFRVEARIEGVVLAIGTMILAYPTYTARSTHSK